MNEFQDASDVVSAARLDRHLDCGAARERLLGLRMRTLFCLHGDDVTRIAEPLCGLDTALEHQSAWCHSPHCFCRRPAT